MKKFKLIILTLLAITVCVGCDIRTNKEYGFSEVSAEIPYGEISLKMLGAWTDNGDSTSVTGTPYEMMLWITLQENIDFNKCSAILQKVILRNKENGDELLVSNRDSDLFIQTYEGEMVAFLSFKNLDIPFANHELSFQYSLSEDCGLGTDIHNLVFPIEKRYSETKYSIWDLLRYQ